MNKKTDGKTNEEILYWYNHHIMILKQQEKQIFERLTPEAKQAIDDLLKLTSEDSQNQELNQLTSQIEQLITNKLLNDNTLDIEGKQQKIAQAIVNLNNKLQVFGEDISGLEALAKGDYDKAIVSSDLDDGLFLVSNEDLNQWIIKILGRVEEAKRENYDARKFGGYISNLKGAYLELAAIKLLKNKIPVAMYETGNIKSGRQIAEDIMVMLGDGSSQTLQEYIKNTNKGERTVIPISAYSKIQKESFGISVKAGKGTIKIYEGNLEKFFLSDLNDLDVDAYYKNVKLRWRGTGHKDNPVGRSVNQYLVAKHLNYAFGGQVNEEGTNLDSFSNIFLSTRNSLLTTTRSAITNLRDKQSFLYMYYDMKQSLFNGRISKSSKALIDSKK